VLAKAEGGLFDFGTSVRMLQMMAIVNGQSLVSMGQAVRIAGRWINNQRRGAANTVPSTLMQTSLSVLLHQY
jgi:hypothetical protein